MLTLWYLTKLFSGESAFAHHVLTQLSFSKKLFLSQFRPFNLPKLGLVSHLRHYAKRKQYITTRIVALCFGPIENVEPNTKKSFIIEPKSRTSFIFGPLKRTMYNVSPKSRKCLKSSQNILIRNMCPAWSFHLTVKEVFS